MIRQRSSLTASAFWNIEWHEQVVSTMDTATELAKAGAPSGTVVVADFQSAGRGTHGRTWHAAPGTCLMFTLLVRPDYEPGALETLPLKVARSVGFALSEHTGVEVDISPPNDLVIQGRKVAGVLCTSRIVGASVKWLLCGIGINTNMNCDHLPLPGATSLQIETGGVQVEHHRLLSEVLDRLDWLRAAGCASCAGYADKPILFGKVQ